MEPDTPSTEIIGPLVAGVGWTGGLMAILVATSVVGFAWWWATVMRPDLGRVIARALIGALGAFLVGLGGWAIALGTEIGLGFPLGRSSGGGAILGYWAGLAILHRDLALSAALLLRGGHRTLAWLTALSGVVAWLLTVLMAFFAAMIALAQLLP